MNTGTLDLRDIHSAPPPDFWPPAPGWWFAALLLLALALLLGRHLYRRWRHVRQRRMILEELERLQRIDDRRPAAERLAELSALLRRVALMRYDRRRVAPLTGEDWLHFLDETGGGGRFCAGPGKILEQGPYVPHVEDRELRDVLQLAREWLQKNTGAAHEH